MKKSSIDSALETILVSFIENQKELPDHFLKYLSCRNTDIQQNTFFEINDSPMALQKMGKNYGRSNLKTRFCLFGLTALITLLAPDQIRRNF